MNIDEEILSRTSCLIGDEMVFSDSGEMIQVDNPATMGIIGHVPNCGKEETDRAISIAADVFPAWRSRTALERANIMLSWYNLIMENQEGLARLMTLEQGKPLKEARGEIAFGASFIRWFAEEARRVYGEIVPPPAVNKRIHITKEPVGVVGIITPWNFPMSMIARKVGPAMAVGCPSVIKPASQTPFSALAMARLAQEAGVPAGVINVITGDSRAIGGQLTGNPIVRKVSFTGSTRVGKVLLQQCAGSVKKVSMELGGNAPFIVFGDADIDKAIEGAMLSKYRNSGQTCVCTNRFYVQSNIYDRFLTKFRQAVSSLKVGDGLEEGVSQGPLIDSNAIKHVSEQIEDGLSKGARLVIGGKRHSLGRNYFEPTILANVTQDMNVAHEETFGPLAPVFEFETEKEVISLANDTEYGLAAYIYTSDINRSFRVSEALEYGLIGVNDGHVSTCEAPFGGIKESGLGREGSRHGIDDYTEIKYTSFNIDM
ncbi:NAD-dependent succinate-semialdehyde dehydrogenase [Desulfohalobium retbaense]|uniref:Succinic semialdehyde dehydrogenase n=1 Tax=Desulfohalobium retbaense (strain ATCC 49708 / DSM 5692 / JCM 16813 / HR100) TaxID=485915 RepID=C8X594_DESRD|nr:NAD-dependent succinate-semialdehyde dehydrogenase [Desulfohalobium retbaense]ACV69591.1 succinic semialdehyde dehydrogenase [Desulfohalobium retbaense DSM 5692]